MGSKPQELKEVDFVVQEARAYFPGDIKHTNFSDTIGTGQH